MQLYSKLIWSVFIVISLFHKSTCIQCYYCNSANNSACLDLNEYDDELRTRLIPIVNCNTAIPSPVAVNFFCRKIVQTIFHPSRESEVRVTRGCGWIRSHHDCYRADNSDHLETVCQCFQDHCNMGQSINPGKLTGLFPILFIIVHLCN